MKLHAEQLSNLGGRNSRPGMGRSRRIIWNILMKAVFLPWRGRHGRRSFAGAYYTLRETQLPPVDLFRKYNVPMALASDANPGSSPMTSLLLTMNMACTLFRLTPEKRSLVSRAMRQRR